MVHTGEDRMGLREGFIPEAVKVVRTGGLPATSRGQGCSAPWQDGPEKAERASWRRRPLALDIS